MNGNQAILPVREEHLDAIAALEEQCFSCPWPRELFARQLQSGRHVLLCALEEGAVAGYGGFEYVLDEGYIGNVAVDSACRRRGLGRALVEAMMAEARRLSLAFLTLEVRAGNVPARGLYEAMGFETVGVRKNYYEKPTEDAILMTVFLSRDGEETLC